MTRTRGIARTLAAVAFSVAAVLPLGAQEAPLTLADLERLALEKHPALAQAAADVEAARGRALQAGLLPNPTVGYTGEEISGGPVIRGGEHGFFVEQTFPLGGKLRLSRRIFEREADRAVAEGEAQRYRVLNTVRALYYRALTAARRVEVRERLAGLTAEAVGVSQQLFNVGAADRPDLLDVEIEAQQARLALTTARNELHRVWQELAAAVGDPTLAPRPLAGSLEEGMPELEREAALAAILRDSPELKAAGAAVERAQAALARAQKEPVPDLVVRGGPRYNRELLDVGGRPVGWEAFVDVGITVPLFNRNQGAVAAARAEVTRAREEVRRVELALRARLAALFDEYLTSLRMAEAYGSEVLPRAEQAYTLYLSKYREVAAAYPQPLVARRTLFQVTDQYLTALEGVWRSAVQIQGYLLGGGLDTPAAGGMRD